MRKSILLIAIFLSAINSIQAQKLDIIPKPVKTEQHAGTFIIPPSVQIVVDKKLKKSANYITANFAKNTNSNALVTIGRKQKKNAIAFLVEEKMEIPTDGYKLTVSEKGILIKGKSASGVLNGFQTLMQICSAKEVKKGTVPFVTIEDYPRFEWRGMMLDCSRQFFDKQTVKNYIDWLAAHKNECFSVASYRR